MEAHERKREYYAGNRDLVNSVAGMLQMPAADVDVSTVTLTWRGVWAEESRDVLQALGISRTLMRGITTRVLKGSYMNFKRFTQMTSMVGGRSRLRMSGWGPPLC